MAAGLLDKKESEDSSAVIGPSMPEPEPPHTEVRLTAAGCFVLGPLIIFHFHTVDTNITAARTRLSHWYVITLLMIFSALTN